ncbi:testis-expressed protein 10 [Stomoxys calcitrans]|uniref:Pre-rRNA-processing protein Ipi1 N-terminal domain-containing protein n=1 Tax=Stomoxys calcitrans TaxID=35570 RepID=A0A1I8PX04_STOCA|nr:testis-expressed protein 10 [Stomoxys calcitrans]
MGGTHKKKLRAEKAKVKLKGAKLPKGLNVTKTEFKVRKITIREQLKESQFSDGIRQTNIKECLSKLKHHSSNFRIEALRNLRDAVSVNHVGLTASLSELIQGISAICLDQEREPRRESFKTLSALLGYLPVDAVAPFFHIVSSYLRCAMTHIQPNIQEDSLLLLDVLLQHIPSLVATHSAKILQNFLEMISRVRAEGDKAGRMLTVNMGQKQTTIKWRSKVLLRLQQMLETLAEFKMKQKQDIMTGSNTSHRDTIVSFSNKTAQYYGIKRCFAAEQSCDLSHLFNRSVGSSALSTDDTSTDEYDQLHSYVDHLMPLLLESWLEVRPHQAVGTINVGVETLLTLDAALTLKIVLEIIENLWTLIGIYEEQVNNKDLSTWFKDQYADVFAANFLQSSYPYQQIDSDEDKSNSKRKTVNQSSGLSPFCLQQNITIGFLMCRFYAEALDRESVRFNSVLNYLTRIITNAESNKTNSQNHLRPLVAALRALLLESGRTLTKLHKDSTIKLLRSCIKAFLGNKFGEIGISSKILQILCEIVQCRELCEIYGPEEFNDFLRYLPNLLLKPTVSVSCLLAMNKLGKQQNMVFIEALKNVLLQVVEHLQSIQVIGAHNVLEGKKHIMNLFYWLTPQKSISQKEMQEINKVVEAVITDKRVSGYCHYILTLA